MKTTIAVFMLVIIFTIPLLSQTIIPPGDVYGNWPLNGSPYLIQGDVQIPNDSTLTIEPGVIVEFQGHFALNVQGRLLANGAVNDSIYFTVNDTIGFGDPDTSLGGWYGLRFIDTPAQNDSSKISYCRFEYGKAFGAGWHTNCGGAICIIQFHKVLISHCLFINNRADGPPNSLPCGGAVHFAFSNIRLIENTFKYNRAHLGGAIHFHGSSPTFVNNTITYNRAYQGGGIVVEGDCQPVFDQDIIRDNRAEDRGGGIVCWNPSMSTLNNVTLTGNTAFWGGGIGVYDCEIYINNCDISENRASSLGGGIHADFSILHIEQSTFRRDTSDSGSGGIHVWYGNLDATSCTFRENIAGFNGGGIHSDFSQLEFNNCDFIRNTATIGAGIDAYNIDLTIDSCLFSQNFALDAGGAIYYSADTSDFLIPYQLDFRNNRFELNSATNLAGGMTINQYDSDSSLVNLLIERCSFVANAADHVAALRILGSIHNFLLSNSIFSGNDALRWAAGANFVSQCRGKVLNCLFYQNHSGIGGGSVSSAGAGVSQEAQVDFINCTFVENISRFGAGLHVRQGGVATVMNSIIWGNANNQISLVTNDLHISSLTLNYCNVQQGEDSIMVDSLSQLYWGVGNIDADPQFSDPAGGDYRLHDNSPCIGAGIDSLQIAGSWYLAPTMDIQGNPRPNPAGSMPDMGAYESPLGVAVPIDQKITTLPKQFALFQNYPNPFNPNTTISWQLPVNSVVKLEIYNLRGQKVTSLIDQRLRAGSHSIKFDASKLASGVYFYRLEAGQHLKSRKMVLLK